MSVCLVSAEQGALFFHQHPHLRGKAIFGGVETHPVMRHNAWQMSCMTTFTSPQGHKSLHYLAAKNPQKISFSSAKKLPLSAGINDSNSQNVGVLVTGTIQAVIVPAKWHNSGTYLILQLSSKLTSDIEEYIQNTH